MRPTLTGSALLAVYRSSYGPDFDQSAIASPGLGVVVLKSIASMLPGGSYNKLPKPCGTKKTPASHLSFMEVV